MKDFTVFSDPPEVYDSMLNDISEAKKYIFLETYIYHDDEIGNKFKQALIKKAKQGVKIKLLLDAWGTGVKKSYFKELEQLGAEIRFFREIKYLIRIFSKNHERNHRKLLLIDDKITYLGSMNITQTYIKSRELMLRINGKITMSFVKSFLKSWDLYGDFTSKRMKSIFYEEFEIINDIPSYYSRVFENRFIKLIKKSKKEIIIETPYFVPSVRIRNALEKAVKRGVSITVITPYISNVRIIDLVRNRYLGNLHKKGIQIYYYKPGLLHSKLMVVDDSFFLLGSSNIDYRSFIYQYEINFIGKEKEIISELKKHFNKTFSMSVPFNYQQWKKRSSFKKILELILYRVRHYL